MKSTVIIPNYNGKDYLENCLKSLQQCEPLDFKVIVVDNGSTDGSVEMLQESFSWVEKILLPENKGFAEAVNIGLEKTETEYGILLNNDTTVKKDFVAKLEEVIGTNEKIFSVSAKMVSMHEPEVLDGAGDLYCALGWAFALGKGKPVSKAYTKPARIFSACGGAVIYRMHILKEIGMFDPNHFAYLEDVDLGYRGLIYGYENRYAPEAVCFHAGSGFSGSRYNEFKVTLSSKNSTYVIVKNMPFLQQIINLPFFVIGFLIKYLFFISKGFGGTYLKGLIKGITFGYSKEGRMRKVRFRFKNLGNYVKIQGYLWWNILRRFVG